MPLKDKLRVLVVDDTSTSRGLLVQGLEAIGLHNVVTAVDGRHGLLMLSQHQIHLVLSDFYMPEMDGMEFLAKLRERGPAGQIGFILVTGRANPELVARGRKLGMNNLLHKPFTHEELRKVIEAVVGKL